MFPSIKLTRSSSEKSLASSDADTSEHSEDDKDNNTSLAQKAAQAIVKTVLDYGPPYSDEPFDVELINECARPNTNLLELHNLLNKRLNPNLPDPDDLYYTPIHWCARNHHLVALKMLRRAGAKVNVTNEMGVTPLDLAVMMRQPPDKRKKQLKTVRYLLEQGADCNNRDKGGFSAIDHAAANNDFELIEMLLLFGAQVRRDNVIFVAKRQPVLHQVHDPDCYRLLYEALMEQEKEFNTKKAQQDKELSLKAEDKYYEQNLQQLNKKKRQKDARNRRAAAEEYEQQLLRQRMAIIDKEFEQLLKEKEKSKYEVGHWERNPPLPSYIASDHSVSYNTHHRSGKSSHASSRISSLDRNVRNADENSTILSSDEIQHKPFGGTSKPITNPANIQWTFQLQPFHRARTSNEMYLENHQIMHNLYEHHKKDLFAKRWKELTENQGELEVRWEKAEPFKLPHHELKYPTQQQFGQTNNMLSALKMSDDSTIHTNTIAQSFDLNYRDRNDEELAGEDLDDILSDLKSL